MYPHRHLELSREIYPRFRYSQTQQLSKKNPSSKKSNHLRKISPFRSTPVEMTIGEIILYWNSDRIHYNNSQSSK